MGRPVREGDATKGERTREDRGEKVAVKDGEGRERTRYFGEHSPPAHKLRRVGSRALATSFNDRGIPLRDARINRFPASL